MAHLLDRVEALLRRPPRTVLSDGERHLDQRELFSAAADVGAALADVPSGSSSHGPPRVAVALPRGIAATIAIHGVLTGGGCYVPLDVAQPPARLRTVVEDAGVSAAVGRGARPAWLPDAVPWLDLASIPRGAARWRLPAATGGEDLAAILYTSGSTGRPRGIALSHRAMIAFADWAGETFGVSTADRVAALAPPFFDLSVFDLFTTVRHGAAVEIVPPGLTMAPTRLADWLSRRRITAWYTVPGMLGFLVRRGGLGDRRLPLLRQVLFAGEVMPPRVLRALAEALPGARLANLFGPTETNVCCWWPVDRHRVLADPPPETIPIGGPAAGDELRVEPGTGQLLVRGPTLMSGYVDGSSLHLPRTADGYYPTGDRVTRGDDGALRFAGRLDDMIKIDGYRVEPAEVEAALLSHPLIGACVVVAADTPDGPALTAVVEADDDPPPAELRALLASRLPRPMHPRRIRRMSPLPRLPNGKLDRRRAAAEVRSSPGPRARPARGRGGR